MIRAALVCAACCTSFGVAQAETAVTPDNYVFERFVGTWKLKEDRFEQVWDGSTVQVLSIPGHRTDCGPINTDKTILCQVDAVDFKGHILWAFEEAKGEVSHLSHFGSYRLGTGKGKLDSAGNLSLEISFSDEPDGYSRRYSYVWNSADEYQMWSKQFDSEGNPTGNYYGGVFERVQEPAS